MVPFEIKKGSEKVPYTRTEAIGIEYNDITLVIKLWPSCSKENRRYLQSTLSKAFSASNNKRQAFSLCLQIYKRSNEEFWWCCLWPCY